MYVLQRFASETLPSMAFRFYCFIPPTCCQSPTCTIQQSSVLLFPAHCEFRHDNRRCCFPHDIQPHSLSPVTAVLSRYDVDLGGGQELIAICAHPPADLKRDLIEMVSLNESTHMLTAAPSKAKYFCLVSAELRRQHCVNSLSETTTLRSHFRGARRWQ